MTGQEIMKTLKESPYEEWLKIYDDLNCGRVKTEDFYISMTLMDYIENSCEYIPELKRLFKEKEKENIKECNSFVEKYLFENSCDSQNQCENCNGKFKKYFLL